MADVKTGQQVVVRKKTRNSGPATYELKVGTVSAMSSDGLMATVSLPGPFGRVTRQQVATDSLQPVSAAFRRSSVQFNPAFRGLASGR